jgi:hypothetical protein
LYDGQSARELILQSRICWYGRNIHKKKEEKLTALLSVWVFVWQKEVSRIRFATTRACTDKLVHTVQAIKAKRELYARHI